MADSGQHCIDTGFMQSRSMVVADSDAPVEGVGVLSGGVWAGVAL